MTADSAGRRVSADNLRLNCPENGQVRVTLDAYALDLRDALTREADKDAEIARLQAKHGETHDRWKAERTENTRLKEELASAEAQCEALEAKVRSLSAHEKCGCSYDRPDDICMHHSPQLTEARAEVDQLSAYLTDAHADLTTANARIAQLEAAHPRTHDHMPMGAEAPFVTQEHYDLLVKSVDDQCHVINELAAIVGDGLDIETLIGRMRALAAEARLARPVTDEAVERACKEYFTGVGGKWPNGHFEDFCKGYRSVFRRVLTAALSVPPKDGGASPTVVSHETHSERTQRPLPRTDETQASPTASRECAFRCQWMPNRDPVDDRRICAKCGRYEPVSPATREEV